MDLGAAREFLLEHPRAVLATRRRDGSPQLSPVVVAVSGDGRIMVSSRETAYKVANMRRDPQVSLCAMSDAFFGPWVQVDGRAEVVSLPGAMDALVDYYQRVSGEHSDWDEYREAMERDRRVMVYIDIGRAGPDRSG